jgi:hypothetical protein
MKDGHQVCVLDIDGTAFRGSLPPRMQEFLSRYKRWLIPFSPLLPLYILRPCDRKTRALIRENQEKGGRNIFFSATKNVGLFRWMVKACLTTSRMPFNKLILCPNNESTCDFKLRVVQEEGCDILLENEPDIVRFLTSEMRQEGVRSDVVKNGGYFIIRFSKN